MKTGRSIAREVERAAFRARFAFGLGSVGRREWARSVAPPAIGRTRWREAGRTPLYDGRLGFALLTSQKAGSTAAVQWYLWHAGLLDEARDHDQWVHRFEREVIHARSGYLRELGAGLRSGSIPAVKIVRDPVARALTGYLELNAHWAHLAYADHWVTFWRQRALRGIFGRGVDFHRPFSFFQYLQWLSAQNVDRLNGHLRPQHTRIEDSIQNLETCRLEDGPDLWRSLEDRFSLAGVDGDTRGELVASRHHRTRSGDGEAAISEFVHTEFGIGEAASVAPALTTANYRSVPDAAALVDTCFGVDLRQYGWLYGLDSSS